MINEHRIMVAVSGGGYDHLLRLEVGGGSHGTSTPYFSMTGSLFSCRTKEVLLDAAECDLQDLWDSELLNTAVVQSKLDADAYSPEWTSDDKLEWLSDVEEWVDAPDGIEWGIENVAGGQMCDRWELLIPDRPPHPNASFDSRTTPDDEHQVLWLIEPDQYGYLLDLWNQHPLKRLGDPEYIDVPQWVVEMAKHSLSLEQAFLRWWWKFQFPEKYERELAKYRDCLLYRYRDATRIDGTWNEARDVLSTLIMRRGYPFAVVDQETEMTLWRALQGWWQQEFQPEVK